MGRRAYHAGRRGFPSTRQIDDARAIVAVAGQLDHDYIEHWARHLGILEPWHQIAGA